MTVVLRMSMTDLVIVPLVVVNAKRDWQGNREEDHLIGDGFLEVKECGPRDVGGCEGGAGVVAGGNLGGGCIDNACEYAGSFNGNVLRVKEPRVVAAMPEEELMFKASVGLEDRGVCL